MRDMDAVFKALSDPARRRLLDRLNEHGGLTLTELCQDMGMTRQSVSKHLAVLEEAEVVTTLRRGREKLHYLNAAPINDIADRWIHHYDRTRAEALSDLKTALEATAMSTTDTNTTAPDQRDTTFVYTTYIHATPEKVWQGLTDPTFTKQYWRHPTAGGVEMRTDWKKGSTYDVTYEKTGLVVSHPDQVILESDPYRRLAYTWHTFTPEWAVAHGIDDALRAQWAAEQRSKVSFDLEDAGDGVVKLTCVHDGFAPGSEVLQAVSGGWPAVLSALKTLLETGSTLS
jgi:DNA-binding transcriptional ArsR family regulator/uncharacterized protein YndB with AHSA1/START domain